MDNLVFEGFVKILFIFFNVVQGVLEFKGCFIFENLVEFYKLLNDWIDFYGKELCMEIIVDVKLEYFNIFLFKCIFDLFKKFEFIFGEKMKVFVNWYYEQDDEDMEEVGQDYQVIILLFFNIIEVEEI